MTPLNSEGDRSLSDVCGFLDDGELVGVDDGFVRVSTVGRLAESETPGACPVREGPVKRRDKNRSRISLYRQSLNVVTIAVVSDEKLHYVTNSVQEGSIEIKYRVSYEDYVAFS